MFSLKKIKKIIIYAIIFTIPLEISKFWFPFLLLDTMVDGRSVSALDLSRLLILLLILISVITFLLKNSNLRFTRISIIKGPFILFIMYIFSCMYSKNIKGGISEIIRLTVHIALFIEIVRILDINDILKSLYVYRITCIILSSIAIIQFITKTSFFMNNPGRYNVTVGDPNILGRYLAINLLFETVILRKLNIKSIFGIGVVFIGLLLTQSRSSIFAFILSLIFGLLFLKYNNRVDYRKIKKRLMIIMIVLFIPGIIYFSSTLIGRFSELNSGTDTSIGNRLVLIMGGIEIFKSSPIIGVGLRSFPIVIKNNYSQFLIGKGTESHSVIITILAENGIIGIVILLFLIYLILKTTIKLQKDNHEQHVKSISFAMMLAMFVIFICAQSEGKFFEDTYLWIFWAILMKLTVKIKKNNI